MNQNFNRKLTDRKLTENFFQNEKYITIWINKIFDIIQYDSS